MEIEDVRFHAPEDSLNGIFTAMCEGAARASQPATDAMAAVTGTDGESEISEQTEGSRDADASMAALMKFVASGGQGFFDGGAACAGGEEPGEDEGATDESAARMPPATEVDLSTLSAQEVAALPLELRAADESEMTEEAAATMHRLAAMLDASEERSKRRFDDAE